MSEEIQLMRIYGYIPTTSENADYHNSDKEEILFIKNNDNIMNIGLYIMTLLSKGCSNVYVEEIGTIEKL